MTRLSLFICLFFTQVSWGQDSISTAQLDFELRDGVYFSAEAFVKNRPDLKYANLRTAEGKTPTQIDIIGSDYLYDSAGTWVPLNKSSLFGFTLNGTFYLGFEYQKEFYFARSVSPGTLWQLVCLVTTYDTYATFDPYYVGDYRRVPSKNMIQLIFHFPSRSTFLAEHKTLAPLLRQDEAVKVRMDKLSKRKQKKMLFYLLRKFNENNPVKFPN
ncbi:MAG: hypothetical protein ACPF8V_03305 [Luteibaculum sp.]